MATPPIASSSGPTPLLDELKGSFDPAIPTPEQFLGYPIGSHYTRHDQIVAYFNELARVSPKVHVQVIGKSLPDSQAYAVTLLRRMRTIPAIAGRPAPRRRR